MKDMTEGFLLETIVFEMNETGGTTLLNCVNNTFIREANARKNCPDDVWESEIWVDDKARKEFYFVTKRNGEFSGNGGFIPWKNVWGTHT